MKVNILLIEHKGEDKTLLDFKNFTFTSKTLEVFHIYFFKVFSTTKRTSNLPLTRRKIRRYNLSSQTLWGVPNSYLWRKYFLHFGTAKCITQIKLTAVCIKYKTDSKLFPYQEGLPHYFLFCLEWQGVVFWKPFSSMYSIICPKGKILTTARALMRAFQCNPVQWQLHFGNKNIVRVNLFFNMVMISVGFFHCFTLREFWKKW